MRKFIKSILPKTLVKFLEKIIYRPSSEYKWIKQSKKALSKKLKKELIITPEGEFYLRSDYGFDFLIDMNEKRLVLNTFDDPDFKILIDFLSIKLPPKPIILDIGAFMGGYAIGFAKNLPNGKIYAFEPVINSFYNLKKNIIRNKLENVIFPFRIAISDLNGEVIMTSKQTTNNHIIVLKEKTSYVEKVSAMNIDTFLKEQKIDKVDFIKCDVEGHEMAVINGAMETIDKCKPMFYLEINEQWASRYGYKPEELISKLNAFGYQPNKIEKKTILPLDLAHDNLAFINNYLFLPYK